MLCILRRKEDIRGWNVIGRRHIKAIQDAIGPLPLIDVADDTDLTGMDVINVGDHIYAGSEVLNAVAMRLSKARRFYLINDDYKNSFAVQIRRAREGKDNCLLTHYRNFPREGVRYSIFDTIHRVKWCKCSSSSPTKTPMKDKDFIYWGTFRPNRLLLFKKYFNHRLYDVHLSASDRSHRKFMLECYHHIDIPKVSQEQLAEWHGTVYITDRVDEKAGPMIANRFFEAVSARMTIGFHYECIGAFAEEGIDVTPWIVHGPEDMNRLLNKAYDQFAFIKPYYSELLEEIRRVFDDLLLP